MTGLDRGLLTGLAAFRWISWMWMAIVLVATRDELEHPASAIALTLAALAITAAMTVSFRVAPRLLLTPGPIVAELIVGALVLAADEYVYAGDHPQSLGSAWPLSGILAAGVAFGPVGGTLAGASLGLARWAGHPGDSAVSLVSTGVLYALAAGAQGLAAVRLRAAESEVAASRAREEVARTLHDGVLQTLAIVQRRSADPELARLAREQERDLREWLFGSRVVATHGAGGDLGAAVRAMAARFEDRFEVRTDVIVADDVPALDQLLIDAVAGAVGEALTNAAKHGHAKRVIVYAEPAADGTVFCSVKDDGAGFDADRPEGIGLSRSIRGRIVEVGGRVEVDGNPGRGAEVRLWVPGSAS